MLTRRSLLAAAAAASLVPAFTGAAQTDDGSAPWPTVRWRGAEPERQGLNATLLGEADRLIRQTVPHVTGLVVIRNGFLVHERYFGEGYGRPDPVKIRSITKSVVGTLIGIALDEGDLRDLDQTLGELIPDRIPAGADPITPTITLRHLLTMTSGWAWDIGSDYWTLIGSENWAELTLGLPVIYEPGSFYAYNTGGSHLLSVVLTAATGVDTADYAQEKLFDPLGIARPTWQRSPQDEAVGGFGLELRPRDLAKIGLLALREGEWDGRRLVSADYLRAATTYQSSGDSTGFAAYGYQWWVTETYGYPAFFGLGFGSQYLYVVPALDLVVVIAAGFEEPPAAYNPSRPVIESAVVPAALG